LVKIKIEDWNGSKKIWKEVEVSAFELDDYMMGRSQLSEARVVRAECP